MNRLVVVVAIAALTAVPSFAQDSVVEVPSNVTKEMVRTKVDPVYPQSAIADNVGGVVALHAAINKYGQITELDVIKGPEALRSSALEAVRQWTFVPYMVKKQMMAISTTILVQYIPYEIGMDINRDGKIEHYGPSHPGPAVHILGQEPPIVAGVAGMAGVLEPDAGPQLSFNIPKDTKMIDGGKGSFPLANGAVRLSSGASASNLVSRVPPKYPAIARAAKVQGAVILQAQISESGSVEALSVISGPPLLVQAAIDAVHQWKWKPYVLNGKPIKVDTTLTVNFNIQK